MKSEYVLHNLSIIAVRILPHCRDSIRKCLKENKYYYLNTNFDISEDGNTITLRERYLEPINDTFFNQDEIFDDEKLKTCSDHEESNPTPNISISAIVGKNGDGKSSLVELIIRILNNFAYRKGLNANNHLRYVEGVYGELFYRLNGKFYKIRIGKVHKNGDNVEFYEYTYDQTEKIYRSGNPLTEFNPDDTVFYTFVSNYSHFAYNTEEFSDESTSDDVEDHWLHRLFHKNDAYQTPLNLHPYRYKGNIDINRERSLSTQRLLTTIAGSFRRNDKGRYETSIDINGKTPFQIFIQDPGKSKLQEVTLRKYFQDQKKEDIIKSEIEKILEISFKPEEDKSWKDAYIGDLLGTSLSILSRHYLTDEVVTFLENAIIWLKENNSLENESDLGQLIDNINVKNGNFLPGYYISDGDLVRWKTIKSLSAVQFLRLALVYDICTMWSRTGVDAKNKKPLSFDPLIIFKQYDLLTNKEKCCHYIIYKTIEIFHTYASYGDPLKPYESADTFFQYRGSVDGQNTLFDLNSAFDKLSKDWTRRSHNTLKLRQTYNLFCKSSRKLYKLNRKENGKKLIFKALRGRDIKILSNIETLPPPIFKWEIMFRRLGEEELIPFSTFSSGEKQKLFFRSAIVYHLQNLNNIGEEKIHYNAVNLIFEEIELYFHPEWQRTLIFDLVKSIRTANIPRIRSVNMIFVTHSPYILSDIPKSNVLFLKDGRPTYEMQENTFGANINSLLKNGFFLPSLPMGEFAYRKINTLFEKLHTGKIHPMTIDQLYTQIMTVGEPAIRIQLMTLFAPYNMLRRTEKDIIEKLRKFLSESQS